MVSGQGRNFQNMDIIFSGLVSCFVRCLEQWVNVYIKVEIGKVGSNYFGVLVVVILFKFGNYNLWVMVFLFCKLISQLVGYLEIIILFVYFVSVYIIDNVVCSLVVVKMVFYSCINFIQGSMGMSSYYG